MGCSVCRHPPYRDARKPNGPVPRRPAPCRRGDLQGSAPTRTPVDVRRASTCRWGPASLARDSNLPSSKRELPATRTRRFPDHVVLVLWSFTVTRWLRGTRTLQMPKLSKPIIEAAIAGFEVQKKSIDGEIADLRAMLTGSSEAVADQAPAKRKGRKVSVAAIKRMSEAQKLRWAKIRGESKATPERSRPRPPDQNHTSALRPVKHSPTR